MSVCRYYLQGCCRFGDRCRFKHVDYSPEYSNKRNDYDYEERYDYQQYSNVSSNPRRDAAVSWNNQQYNYERYNPDQRYSENQFRKDRNYRSGSTDNVWYSDSKHERYPSASNYHPKKSEKGRKEWTSDDNKKSYEHKTPKGSHVAYDASNQKTKVPFSFKNPSSLSKQDSTGLNMTEANMLLTVILKKDASQCEVSGVWPFTSYSPIPGNYCFPGFVDISPEELRHEAYIARENNTLSSYVESVQKATFSIKMKRDKLKEPSVPLMSTIEMYLKGENLSSNCNVDGGNIFSKSSGNTGWKALIANEPQVPQQPTASTFSFETANVVKASTSSFSFKVPSSQLYSKQNVPDAMTNIESIDIYTPQEKLSFQDREQFSASKFSMGRIPTTPPPKSMC